MLPACRDQTAVELLSPPLPLPEFLGIVIVCLRKEEKPIALERKELYRDMAATQAGYMSGFGNEFATEALPGAVSS